MGGKRLKAKKTLKADGSTAIYGPARIVLRQWGAMQHVCTVKPEGQRKKKVYSDVTCRR